MYGTWHRAGGECGNRTKIASPKNFHLPLYKRGETCYNKSRCGALAQLVAHNTGSVGVRSSNLLCSTQRPSLWARFFCWDFGGRGAGGRSVPPFCSSHQVDFKRKALWKSGCSTIFEKSPLPAQQTGGDSRLSTNPGWRPRARKPFNARSKIGEPLRGVQTGRSPCAAIFVLFRQKKLHYTNERPGEG